MPTTIELTDEQTAIVFNADGSHAVHMAPPQDPETPLTQPQYQTLLVAVLLTNEEVMHLAAQKLDAYMQGLSQASTSTIIT